MYYYVLSVIIALLLLRSVCSIVVYPLTHKPIFLIRHWGQCLFSLLLVCLVRVTIFLKVKLQFFFNSKFTEGHKTLFSIENVQFSLGIGIIFTTRSHL